MSRFYYLRKHPLRLVLPLTLLVFLSAGSLFYWRAPSVLLTYDGKTRRIFSKAATIQELLQREHITLGPDDFTTPPLPAPLTKNLAIKLTRVEVRFSTAAVNEAPVVTWRSDSPDNLRRALVERGFWAENIQKIRRVFYDGIEVKHRVITQKRKRHPFFTLTLFDKNGFPAKKYNLLKAKTLHMVATGYYVGDPLVPGDETRLGYKLRRGLVAVDPKVIKLRTRLYVSGYGYAYAADTGSKIKKLRIDLAVKDRHEERRYGHRKVTVYVLEKARKW